MATAITATLTSWLRRSTPGCRPGVFHLLVLSERDICCTSTPRW